MIYFYSRLVRLFRCRYLFYGYNNKTRDINAAGLFGAMFWIWIVAILDVLPSNLLMNSKNLVVLSGILVAVAIAVSRTDYVKRRMTELLENQASMIQVDILFITATVAAIATLVV